MTDIASTTQFTRARSTPHRAEYITYFSLIFVVTLPVALLAWALSMLRGGSFAQNGPIARALTQTRIITPMIFSAR